MEDYIELYPEEWQHIFGNLPDSQYIDYPYGLDATQWIPIPHHGAVVDELPPPNAQSCLCSDVYDYMSDACVPPPTEEFDVCALTHAVDEASNYGTENGPLSPIVHEPKDIIITDPAVKPECLTVEELVSDRTESDTGMNIDASTESSTSRLRHGHIGLVEEHSALNMLMSCSTEIERKELRIVHLLIACAEAITEEALDLAEVILRRLRGLVSPTGTTMERVAYYLFQYTNLRYCPNPGGHVEGDEGSDFCNPNIDSWDRLLGAFRLFHQVYPYVVIAHFTANQSILEAIMAAAYNHTKLHIIDFDIAEGMQWPPLMEALTDEDFQICEIRISAVKWGTNSVLSRDTARRLSEYANFVGIQFCFEEIEIENVRKCVPEDENTVVVVNCMWQLPHLCERSKLQVSEFLHGARHLQPLILTLATGPVAECETTAFLPRFAHCFQNLCAVFDSLEAGLREHGLARAVVERIFFGSKMCRFMMDDHGERVLNMHPQVWFW